MSLFEWLGESSNPGPVGTIEVGGRIRPRRSRLSVLLCLVVSIGLLSAWIAFILAVCKVTNPFGLIALAVATLVYLFLGYTLHPKPNMTNVGWLGGALDHPFRYSDDLNRNLAFLIFLLWPGRLISESLVDTVHLLRYARSSPRPHSTSANEPPA